MFDIIAVGDAVVDTHVNINNASVECDVDTRACRICFDYASKIPITGSFQALGGNAANVACAASKLGLQTAVYASLGKDGNGRLVSEELQKNKVDTSLIEHLAKTQTRYSVVLNFQGERTILSYHEKRPYHWPKNFPASEWIYYTSLSEGYEPIHEALIKHLKKHPSVKLAFNPGTFQLKNTLEKVKEATALSDIVFVNLQEAETICEAGLKKLKSVKGLIRKILDIGAREVVITDAERGAFAGNEDEIWQMGIYPMPVVSKTGAGDAFSAAYLVARQRGHDMHTALAWGAAMSGAVVSEQGPQKGLLDEKGIEKIMKKFPKITAKKLF